MSYHILPVVSVYTSSQITLQVHRSQLNRQTITKFYNILCVYQVNTEDHGQHLLQAQ